MQRSVQGTKCIFAGRSVSRAPRESSVDRLGQVGHIIRKERKNVSNGLTDTYMGISGSFLMQREDGITKPFSEPPKNNKDPDNGQSAEML